MKRKQLTPAEERLVECWIETVMCRMKLGSEPDVLDELQKVKQMSCLNVATYKTHRKDVSYADLIKSYITELHELRNRANQSIDLF